MMLLSTIPQYKKPDKEDSKDKDGIQEVGTLDDLMSLDIQ
jgi:hypothetical protein